MFCRQLVSCFLQWISLGLGSCHQGRGRLVDGVCETVVGCLRMWGRPVYVLNEYHCQWVGADYALGVIATRQRVVTYQNTPVSLGRTTISRVYTCAQHWTSDSVGSVVYEGEVSTDCLRTSVGMVSENSVVGFIPDQVASSICRKFRLSYAGVSHVWRLRKWSVPHH